MSLDRAVEAAVEAVNRADPYATNNQIIRIAVETAAPHICPMEHESLPVVQDQAERAEAEVERLKEAADYNFNCYQEMGEWVTKEADLADELAEALQTIRKTLPQIAYVAALAKWEEARQADSR